MAESFQHVATEPTYPTIHPREYRDVLHKHGIRIRTKTHIPPPGIRNLIQTHVQKPRTSITDRCAMAVMQRADEVIEGTEASVMEIVHLLPLSQDGIAASGSIAWKRNPLPFRNDYTDSLFMPRPNREYGYFPSGRSDFTPTQESIISHPFASQYTEPTTNVRLPFLAVEAKSEADGGSVWHAENQAAVSGFHMISNLQWLFEEANESPPPEGTAAFTICMTARYAVLYLHYYYDSRCEMFPVSRYYFDDAKDIGRCYEEISNVLEWGAVTRRSEVDRVLDKLPRVSSDWVIPVVLN